MICPCSAISHLKNNIYAAVLRVIYLFDGISFFTVCQHECNFHDNKVEPNLYITQLEVLQFYNQTSPPNKENTFEA